MIEPNSYFWTFFGSNMVGLSPNCNACEYGAKFDPKHALSFKKGAFIYLRQNQIQNLTDTLLGEA